MAEILECPVCGKLPKVKHRDRYGEHMVQIICKPLFSKFHESALAYGVYAPEAYLSAIQIWNGRVKHYKEAHQDVGN
jgi:hypothetical protein